MHRTLVPAVLLLAAGLPAQFKGFWERRPNLSTARQEVGAAVLGGKVYVAGGLLANQGATPTVESFDPRTGRWTRIADMPFALHHLGFCAAGGKLYQMGGYVGASFAPTFQCNCWDPATNKWTRIADLPRARGAFVAVAIGGKIYCPGGVEQTVGLSNTLAIYDPVTNKWSFGASMATRREHLAAAEVGGKLYVAGGRARLNNNNVLERYDPASNRWATLAPMPTARGGNGAAALDGKLIVVGGEAFSPNRVFPQTEEYDPATDRWRSLENMLVPAHGIYPVTLGKDMLVAGGGLQAGFSVTNQVTALRRLPTGVERYGKSTPACNGGIGMGVSEPPRAGAASFAFAASPNGPPSTGGVLLLGGTQDLAGTIVLGFRLHVGLQPPLILLATATDATGAARLPVPIPAGARGARLFGQLAFANTPACQGAGPLSASDALDTTIQ